MDLWASEDVVRSHPIVDQLLEAQILSINGCVSQTRLRTAQAEHIIKHIEVASSDFDDAKTDGAVIRVVDRIELVTSETEAGGGNWVGEFEDLALKLGRNADKARTSYLLVWQSR